MNEETKRLWREASDVSVITAAVRDKNGYPPEIQVIIEEEVKKRGLLEEVGQEMALLKKKLEKETKKSAKRMTVNLSSKSRSKNRIVCIVVGITGVAAILLLERVLSLTRMDVLVALLGFAIVITYLWEDNLRVTTVAASIVGVVLILILERAFAWTMGYVLFALFLLFIIIHILDRLFGK